MAARSAGAIGVDPGPDSARPVDTTGVATLATSHPRTGKDRMSDTMLDLVLSFLAIGASAILVFGLASAFFVYFGDE